MDPREYPYNGTRLISIVGPTAVGKTDVAVRLAKRQDAEIISADSRQIYKEMVIGTAPPSPQQLTEVKHHFIGSKSIHDEYDAAMFGDEALAVIDDLFKVKDKPFAILCGGSGLYIKAVLEGFDDIPKATKEFRTQFIKDYKEKGLTWLQERVKELDPEQWQVIDQRNPVRLMRVLEVVLSTGKKMSEWQRRHKRHFDFKVVKIGLTLPMEELYERIDARVDKMVSDGLFQEAEGLYEYRNLQALQTVGYREIFDHLNGGYDKDEAIRLIKRNTRHYAKRQMTWFRKDPEITWLHPDQWTEMVNLVVAL